MVKDISLRYARQIAVPEIGLKGQEKLCQSKVLIIGCGALGSMAAMQLAGAGIGTLGIADYDIVDVSNLQRQFFFNTDEAGQSKVELLQKRVNSLNPLVKTEVYKKLITSKIAEEIFPLYDFIVDATDNPDSKRMVEEICREKNLPCSIGGVRDFMGQAITFLPQDSRFEDYFGSAASEGFLPCSLGGVMGPAAAFCASIQVSETIKFITGTGTLLSGQLFIFNLLKNYFKVFSL